MRSCIALAVCCLLLLGCSSASEQTPIQSTVEANDFYLSLGVNKGSFQEKEDIRLRSSFGYSGEGERRFDQSPSFLITIKDDSNGEIVRFIDFDIPKESMAKEDAYDKEVNDIRLASGKYSAIVQTKTIFSAASHAYSLSTTPISFEIN
ncbi:hypothetical protein J4772_29840 [Cohnella sp. LGH]|uniref:hypothetical protein n=1 Tax=Cohnella sp. LGH TaxID=1619153 RepID=UPI001ADB4C37|nr:hypothetical protein [Cohnella sp. LGH]QTH41690.1 hypothetical protein J4772_29840 [Cohnella sp. LGH]